MQPHPLQPASCHRLKWSDTLVHITKAISPIRIAPHIVSASSCARHSLMSRANISSHTKLRMAEAPHQVDLGIRPRNENNNCLIGMLSGANGPRAPGMITPGERVLRTGILGD